MANSDFRLSDFLKRIREDGRDPELVRETDWSYTYKTGEKSYCHISKFLANNAFTVSSSEIRQRWPKIDETDRLDFVQSFWSKPNWTPNDTEILEMIMQDGNDRLWESCAQAFLKHPDRDRAPLVAVINQTMARQLWPGENPIGKRFRTEKDTSPPIEVVGLAGDGKYQNIMEDPQPWFYIPLNQEFQSLRAIVVRSVAPPESLITEVEREIRTLAPGMPLFNSATGEQVLAQGQFIFRLGVSLAGGMGLLGLFIAVVGVYGVVSYAAAQRTREVGIRIALGAMPADVLKLILRHGLLLIAGGVAAGVIVGWLVTRGIGHIFHGGTGVIVFPVAAALLAATGFLACYVPARRAMRLDPMVALRDE